jgi:type IV pilus assembly protein PilB
MSRSKCPRQIKFEFHLLPDDYFLNIAIDVSRGFPKRLIDESLISPADMLSAVKDAKAANLTLINFICEKQLVDDQKLAQAAAKEFGMAVYDLRQHAINRDLKDLIDRKLMRKHVVVPLFTRGKKLFVATADPFDVQCLRDIQFQSKMFVEAVICVYSDILESREALLNNQADNIAESLSINSADYEPTQKVIEYSVEQLFDGEDVSNETPVVRFVNKMIKDAVDAKASDLHFEPYEKEYRVRFRVDGVLREIFKPPNSWSSRVIARIKVMSQMDITERRIPQDGRIRAVISENKTVDLRVNTLPMQFGEKVVMRILDSSSTKMGIDTLGYDEDQKRYYLAALARPQGMILVTGPTGSGKTVSLYTGINILNTSERNISTAEDPIEINLPGINQTQINTRVGLDFPTAMRAFLRQDPDVLMVGEIRDLDTAEIAVKAAQTGHLVLSTLHTNSAAETLNRLLNMGLSTFNLATSVSLVIAQRLARKLCTHCKRPFDDLPQEILDDEGFDTIGIGWIDFKIFRAVGCKKCTKGYSGRTGIYEVLVITPKISTIILHGGSSVDILAGAIAEGFRPMRISALRKVAKGLISIKEANRITTD